MNKLLKLRWIHIKHKKQKQMFHLDLLFNDATMIGEHTDLLTEVKKWTDSLSQAEENLETLREKF